MVDPGSTFEETLARIDPRGRKRFTAEFNRERYHVFARPEASPASSTNFSADTAEYRVQALACWWIYIAAIHRKPDAYAVSAGLIESGLAVEVEIAVVGMS